MNKRQKTILQMVIVSVAFVLLMQIWPLGYWKHHDVNKCQGSEVTTVSLTKDNKLLEQVRFEKNYLDSITFQMSVDQYEEYALVDFRLYDDTFSCIYSHLTRCELLERDGKVEVPVQLDVEPNRDYYFEWLIMDKGEINDTIVTIPLVTRELAGQDENINFFIDGNGLNNFSYMVDYDYSRELSFPEVFFRYAMIIGCGLVLYILLVKMLSMKIWKQEKSKLILRRILSIGCIFIGVITLFFALIKNTFGNAASDKLVYLSGIGFLLFWALKAIWQEREKRNSDEAIRQMWISFLQTVLFGYAMISACRYVNALSVPTQILNQHRITYCLIALIITMPFMKENLDFRHVWRRINWLTFVPWVLLMVPVIWNRYEKKWTWMLLLFTAFILFKLSKKEQNRLLHSFGNGVYVSYFITMIYALMYRPYNKWILYRYPGMFHTVAYMGMFMSVVVAVSAGRILTTVMRDKKKNIFGMDSFVFSTAVGYIFLSMTRTAILAIAVTALVSFILILWTNKVDIALFLKRGFGILAICILSIFMVFTVTRMVPAIVNEPQYLEIEPLNGVGVSKGEKTDSYNYMTIERYFSIFFGRFGKTETSKEEINQNGIYLASTTPYVPAEEPKSDISNGRFSIFKAYAKNITWESHEDYSVKDPDTEVEYGHAHNAFLQISYLFGLFAGIAFLLVSVISWIASILFFVRNKQYEESLLPFLMVTIFTITGMVEWTFNPCNPIGFAFLFIQAVLMQRAVEAKPKK